MENAALRLDDVPALHTTAVDDVLTNRRQRMFAVARRVTRDDDDADDAVQDACIAALRGRTGFEARSRASTWVHRIVVNSALMQLRTRRRRSEDAVVAGQESMEIEPSAEERVGGGELAAMVRQCIEALPEPHRSVLVLRHLQEHDTAETAARLGVTENAVKIRLHRARHALRRRLVGARVEESFA
jgi:RNA polymerase sigma-70 factor (ECF subfamily)